MFQTSRSEAPNKDFYTDDIVHFYTGLPSTEILMVVFERISRKSLPMKLRLNAPLQDLVYKFVVSLQSTVSRIFSH